MGSSDARDDGTSRPPREPFDVRELQAKIDAALEREHAVWGVLVHSTGLGRDVASRNPDTALVPASNVKMFTAMAALTVWNVGPHRTFDTRAHVVRDDSKGAVLCVHPSGDPTLRPADVDDLARAALAASDVPATEVRRVRLGGKEWQDEGAHPTWEVGDTRRAWAAPPSRATMTSDEADGDAAAPRLPPPPPPPPTRGHPRADPRRPPPPPRHHTGVRVVRDGRPLPRRVAQLPARLGAGCAALEDSDNLVAEQLLRAASGGKDSGRFLTSWSAVQAHKRCPRTSPTADGASPTPRRMRFVDGSGLSRHNLAPPRAFVALVAARASRPRRPNGRDRTDATGEDVRPHGVGDGESAVWGVSGRVGGGWTHGDASRSTARRRGGGSRQDGEHDGDVRDVRVLEKHPDPALGEVVFSVIANNHVGNIPDAAHRLRDVVDEVVALISLARASGSRRRTGRIELASRRELPVPRRVP